MEEGGVDSDQDCSTQVLTALNYDSRANEQSFDNVTGASTCNTLQTGCTDSIKVGYEAFAERDDGSCRDKVSFGPNPAAF